MKKKLNETDIANELRGASLHFQKASTQPEEEPAPKQRRRRVSANQQAAAEAESEVPAAPQEAPNETGVLSQTPSPLEVSASALSDAELLESIRRTVKRLGKEATFCRFTPEEKNVLGDIVYTYKRNGIRTSENEVIRIAVNWLVENYRTDGKNSVLAQVLERLNT